MGGMGSSNKQVATGLVSTAFPAVGIGLMGYNALKSYGDGREAQADSRHQMKNLYFEQMQNQQRKKNILEEQLAKRRASLGSLGISASGSEEAVQSKMVEDVYKDIANEGMGYNNKYSQLRNQYKNENNQRLLNGVLSATNKLIK